MKKLGLDQAKLTPLLVWEQTFSEITSHLWYILNKSSLNRVKGTLDNVGCPDNVDTTCRIEREHGWSNN